MGYTPLHLAVGWPYGIRGLLQHGACVDSIDRQGCTPLFYAIYQGSSERVSLLMKANCLLELDIGVGANNILEHLSHLFSHFKDGLWGLSQETYMDVLDTFIALLAERRRDLQSRVAALSMAVKINIGVFRDDRFLDEYAEYAECAEKDALREYDPMLLRHQLSLEIVRLCTTSKF